MPKLGFLGPRGTFTYEAAVGYVRKFEPSMDIATDLHAYVTKLDVLEAVSCGEIWQGIVPIENSIEGSVSETLDGLLRFDGLYITTEVVMPVSQNLMARPGASIENLTEVWSHPQGIAQCRSWLHAKGVRTSQFSSTAAAAQAVQDSGRLDVAAIGNVSAADVFNLQVLKENLQDESENHTRFIVVRHGSSPHPQGVKSMLLLTPNEERSGVLASILNILAAVQLNLAWIESRPTKRKLGTYQFFLDIESGVQDVALQKALGILGTLGHEVRVLGSYNSMSL